jgi:hypothetical protein
MFTKTNNCNAIANADKLHKAGLVLTAVSVLIPNKLAFAVTWGAGMCLGLAGAAMKGKNRYTELKNDTI